MVCAASLRDLGRLPELNVRFWVIADISMLPLVSQRFSSSTCEMPTRRSLLLARDQAFLLAELFTSLLA